MGLKATLKPQSWRGTIRQKQYNTWKSNHYWGWLKGQRQFPLKSRKETERIVARGREASLGASFRTPP